MGGRAAQEEAAEEVLGRLLLLESPFRGGSQHPSAQRHRIRGRAFRGEGALRGRVILRTSVLTAPLDVVFSEGAELSEACNFMTNSFIASRYEEILFFIFGYKTLPWR